jgi:WD40 repeat protein/tRNA A-37 threonylcarbamoyl transferase component Bud32
MQVCCPHCQTIIESAQDAQDEIVCPGCGSCFCLDQERTRTQVVEHRRLGKFELIDQVGSGAFGAVWCARDTELDRLVAIKIPHTGQLAGEKESQRFVREARSAAQLRHPGIVTVYEVGRFENLPYLVADFIRGINLAVYLESHAIEPRAAAELVAQVAEALDYAHAMGVVHRDVKPSNIMIERGPGALGSDDGKGLPAGRPMLMDFGLALRHDAEATMTQEGDVLGTPAYMSPEQAAGQSHQVDQRSDVYSLGVVLYRLLAGEVPFQGPIRAIIDQVLNDEPKPPRRIAPGVPRDLETICLKAMSKAPEGRYASAREFAEDLRHCLAGEPIRARPAYFWERTWRWVRRHPAAAALATMSMIAALTLVGLAVAVGYQGRLRTEIAEAVEARADEARANQKVAQALRNEERLNYFNRLVLAERELSAGNTSRTRQLLNECLPSLRGWEWNFLNRQCHAQLATLRGHSDQVFGTAWSPDGHWIASASWDRTARLWDAHTYREVRRIDLDAWGWSVAFNRAGTILAVASGHFGQPSRVTLYDVAGGQQLQTLLGHSGPVQGLAFGPDPGAPGLLASSDNPGAVKIWDVASGRLARDLGAMPGGTTSLAFSPDGRRLVVSVGTMDMFWPEKQGRYVVFDTATWRPDRRIQGHGAVVSSLAFSPDGAVLATASYDGTLKLWETASWTGRGTLHGHTQNVSCVAFSPSGNRIASTADDDTCRIWDTSTGAELRLLRGHDGVVNCASFHPSGDRVVTAGGDRTLRVWDVASTPGVLVLDRPETSATDLAFSPDGRSLAVSYLDHTIGIWDVISARLLHTLQGHKLPVWAVAFSPDGTRIASGAGDFHRADAPGEVKLWEAANGRLVSDLIGHKGCVWTVAFSPSGRVLASGAGEFYSGPGELLLWDVADGRLRRALPTPVQVGVTGLAFNNDGALLASADRGNAVHLWDVETGAQRRVLEGFLGPAFDVQFDPTGHWLLATDDLSLRLWDLNSTAESRWLYGHSNNVDRPAFSPDGQRIASPSQDRTIKLWDVASGQEVLTLRGHTAAVCAVAFSPDGQRLASASNDGSVRIWDATPLPEQTTPANERSVKPGRE